MHLAEKSKVQKALKMLQKPADIPLGREAVGIAAQAYLFSCAPSGCQGNEKYEIIYDRVEDDEWITLVME